MKGNCNKCIIANTFKNICEKCNKNKSKRDNKNYFYTGNGILSKMNNMEPFESKVNMNDLLKDFKEKIDNKKIVLKNNNDTMMKEIKDMIK